MTSLVLALSLVTAPGTSSPCACGEDWRDDLPPKILALVRRVDEQQAVATATETKQEKDDLDPKHQKDIESDEEMGKKYAVEVEKEYKASINAEYQARVEAIAKPLAEIANSTLVDVSWGDKRLNRFQYHFKVLEGKDVNAFSLPGGYIYVHEGLIQYAESNDELAGVLAHEISHAAFRHVATLQREQSKLEAVTLPLILVGILTGGAGLATAGSLFNQAMGSGWSVKAEKSADFGAFQYMVQSNYNPVGLLTFMERLAYDENNRPKIDWGIYQTHPPSLERARAVRDLLVSKHIPILRSKVTTSMRAIPKVLEDKSVELHYLGISVFHFYGPSAEERASVTAAQLNAFLDQTPRLWEVRGYGSDAIEGRGETLLQITDDDVEGSGTSMKILRDKALAAIKQATYELTFRVWDLNRQ
ncbi:MAG: M48 family metalloprotease [Armatimonadetes bacterium]|nr:M48 family metalloprotease [Armatimonadota bacterium]